MSAQTQRGMACLFLLSLALFTGCRSAEPSQIDCYVGEVYSPFDASTDSLAPSNPFENDAASSRREAATHPVNWQEPPPAGHESLPSQRPEPLQMPSELPGANTPPLHLPPHRPDTPDAQRQQAIRSLYSPLPTLAQPDRVSQDPTGPLTLESLQMMALENNPSIRQAAANVDAARGAAIQAGTYPNPNAGYEADTVRTANTNGYHGAYFQQTFITAGKLRLAESAATLDIDSSMLNLRQTRIDVASQVRSFYFAAIVAREKLKLARALSNFTEKLYEAQIALVDGGEAAPYEPLQLRVLALQARASVAQSQQEYLSAWRQMAAALGLPGLPLTELAGRPDAPVPRIEYERALSFMLAGHTQLGVAQNNAAQADVLLRLAQVTPVPDLDVNFVVQRDYTFNPGTMTYNLNLGGEIPILNKNRGNIVTAQANVYGTEQAITQIRNDLTGQLGEAFARYEANRVLAESFRAEALRDQVRTYRGIYERYRNDPQGIQFNDVVVAQQTLALTLNQYIDVLGNQWQAVVDIAQLLQVDDMFVMGDVVHVAPIPELDAVNAEQVPVP